LQLANLLKVHPVVDKLLPISPHRCVAPWLPRSASTQVGRLPSAPPTRAAASTCYTAG
jgi:hypothetical protein